MVMVMIALVVGTIITLSFLSSQTTSLAIAHNANRQVQARAVAEDAVRLVIEHVRGNVDWRDDYTHGVWTAAADLNGGSFRVMFEDDDDSDLGDDESEPFVLTVEASFNGVVHRVSNRIVPSGVSSSLTVMLVSDDYHAEEDLLRIALIEAWGHRVITVNDTDSQSVYDAAAAQADVIYVSEESSSGLVNTKLNGYDLGVVNEEYALTDELKFSTSGGTYTGTAIDIVDNSHPITSGLSLGETTIAGGSTGLNRVTGTPAVGLNTLAEQIGSSSAVLSVIDVGDTLSDDSISTRRMVMLPWGNGAFEYQDLNANGQKLMKQALHWAAGSTAVDNSDAVHGWGFDETSGTIAADGQGNADGTYTLSPTLGQPGVRGTAAEFDNTLDRVTLPIETLDGKNDYSFAVWFKTAKTGQQSIISGARSNNNNAQLIFLSNSTTISLYDPSASGGRTTWSISLIADDEWHHLVLVRDGTDGQATMYLDGVSEGTNSVNFVPVDIDHLVLAEEQDRVDGGYQTSQSFVGLLDDAYVFDKALSATEVAALYEGATANAEAPNLLALYEFDQPDPVTPQLVAHWKLDEQIDTNGVDVLFVVPNAGSLSSQDSAKKSLMESWGHTVSLISDESSQSSYDTAAAAAQVIFISEEVSEPSVDEKLRYTTTGVVIEEHDLGWEFRLSSSYDPYSGTQIDIVDNGHYITSPFNIGSLTITSSSAYLIERNSPASGMDELAEAVGSSDPSLGVVEIGKELRDSTRAVGRRVILPWGYSNWNVNLLNTNGQTLFKLALEWAAAGRVEEEVSGNHGVYTHGMDAGQTGFGDGGTAAAFDGAETYVEAPHDPAYLLENGTISFWFYAQDLSGIQGLVAKDASDFGSGGHFGVALWGSALVAGIQDTANTYLIYSAGGAVTANAWNHAAFGFGAGGMQLYLNGALVASNDYAGGLGSNSGGSGNDEPFVFGAALSSSDTGSTTGWSDPFHGRIDDVRLYDQNLNTDQAGDLYANTDPRPAIPAIVEDTSGVSPALDLSIADPDHVTWISGGGLTIDTATSITSGGPVTRLQTAIAESDRFTLEARFSPANITQDGAARIVTYSNGTSNRNFHLGQIDETYDVRLRTESVPSGTPEPTSGDVLVADQNEHVLVTYDGEEVRVYRNGTLEITEAWTGDLDNWNSSYELLMGNEASGNRPWLGSLYRVAIYDGAINKIQADNLFNGDPPGDGTGGDEGLAYQVEWIESP